jgi:hypothetical protein
MTRTLTTLTAAGALVAATLVTTPARAMDPWTAAAWFVGGLFVAGLFWAPYARAARPYGYAAYGYAPGYSYGYAPGYSYGYSPQYAYGATAGMERRQARRAAARNCYYDTVFEGGRGRNVRVCN